MVIFKYDYIWIIYSHYFKVRFIKKKTAKNYSLIIFYFFLSLFSLYIQTEIICEKKIYGHVYNYIYIYIYKIIYMSIFIFYWQNNFLLGDCFKFDGQS